MEATRRQVSNNLRLAGQAMTRWYKKAAAHYPRRPAVGCGGRRTLHLGPAGTTIVVRRNFKGSRTGQFASLLERNGSTSGHLYLSTRSPASRH
ncbi:hypothetical protein E2C01_041231 [Portunus trituberculatus]|uniref:Uncharacterized protein n=1 Tax=Portunus trituberculatus TaxID=210409 RepID=A0A5B7FR52_PORTR|nr:hypothetical protein [Portunus trituberculatus]